MDKIGLILLPGMDGTGRFFEPLLEHLGDQFSPQVIAYPEESPLGYEDLLQIILQRLPRENPYIVLGESFSGPLALMTAATNPPNLKGVVLVATFVRSPMPPVLNFLGKLIPAPFLSLRPRKYLLNWLLNDKCQENIKDWVLKELPKLRNDVLKARIRSILKVDVTEELVSCPVPIQYIAASEDKIVGEENLELIHFLRGDIKVEVLNGPHIILQCQPLEASRAISSFAKDMVKNASSG